MTNTLTSTNNDPFSRLRTLVKSFDLTEQDAFGFTHLHWAAIDNQPDVVEILIAFGADTEARDFLHRTPLILAVLVNAVQAVEKLIEGKANLDAADSLGFTPLHAAVLEKGPVFTMLVEAGAENRPFFGGSTPLDIAIDEQLTERIAVLAKSSIVSEKESSALEI